MYNRKQLFLGSGQESIFLWGARQTGKSTLLKMLFPDALWFDLLISREYKRLSAKPDILRETVLAKRLSILSIRKYTLTAVILKTNIRFTIGARLRN